MSLIIGIVLIIISILMIKKEPRRFSIAVVLMAGIYCTIKGIIWVLGLIFPATNLSEYGDLEITSAGESYIIFLIVFHALIFLVGLYFIGTGIVLQIKEKVSLAHMLPVIYGVILAVYPILRFVVIVNQYYETKLGQFIWQLARYLALYLIFIMAAYIIYNQIYKSLKLKKSPDAVVVLGASLVEDHVSPLLAKRLNRGIDIYKEYGEKADFVVSGGQGADEVCSEASAMKRYLEEQGIPGEKIYMEDKSVNTLQNMKFSHEILKEKNPDYYCAFTSNNYHILRGATYARAAGMNGDGKGCKTAKYYWPAAAIREVVAFVFSYKRLTLYMLIISVILTVLTVFAPTVMDWFW